MNVHAFERIGVLTAKRGQFVLPEHELARRRVASGSN